MTLLLTGLNEDPVVSKQKGTHEQTKTLCNISAVNAELKVFQSFQNYLLSELYTFAKNSTIKSNMKYPPAYSLSHSAPLERNIQLTRYFSHSLHNWSGQSCQKLVSWVSCIPRTIYKNHQDCRTFCPHLCPKLKTKYGISW